MTSPQFLNGVALGQITPGPVVRTVATVGPLPPCPPRHHLSGRSISFWMSLASGYDNQDRYDRQEHDISLRLADT